MTAPHPNTKCTHGRCRQAFSTHGRRWHCPDGSGRTFRQSAAGKGKGGRRRFTPREHELAAAVGAELKRMRVHAGLTMRALGERLGVTHSAIACFESGRAMHATTTLLDFARACGVPFVELAAFIARADEAARAQRGSEAA